eukprot:scaffold2578_cov136-Skeletonema_menzelii.AAC.3
MREIEYNNNNVEWEWKNQRMNPRLTLLQTLRRTRTRQIKIGVATIEISSDAHGLSLSPIEL